MSGERRRPELGNTLTKRRMEPRRRGRLARTILLELDTEELLGFLGASAVFVGLMVILGLVGAAAVLIFKRLGR
jgi:hypothetical protein